MQSNQGDKSLELWAAEDELVGSIEREATDKREDVTRILVTDDNFANVFAITAMLEQHDVKADTATDGAEALKKVIKLFNEEQRTFDLILMDFDMPICTGTESTKLIRKFLYENMPNAHQPYICCLYGYTNEKVKLEAKDAGMNAFLTKPIFSSGIQDLLFKVQKRKEGRRYITPSQFADEESQQ